MSSQKIVMYESGHLKARESNAEVLDFSSIRIGASTLEIKETGGAFDFSAKKLVNLLDPTAAQDAATKAYVDSLAAGLDPKESCFLATAAALPAVTYANGSGGVGATLTADANGALSVDGESPTAGKRILVKNQASALQNGIYTVTQVGDGSNPFILTRASDFDGSPANEINGGEFSFIQSGSSQADTGWVVASPSGTNATLGTTAISWTQFSAATAITAGAGLLQTGNAFDVVSADNSMTINADSIQVKRATGATLGNIIVDASGITADTDGSTMETASNKLQVKDLGISTAKLANLAVTTGKIADDAVDKTKINADIAGLGLSQAVGGELDVNVDASTIEINVDTLRVKDLGISTAKLADDSVTKAKINADVAGNGLSQAVGGELDVNVDGSTLEIDTDSLRVKDLGITTGKLAALAVTTAKIADDAVDKTKINADIAGLGLSQAVGGELDVNVDASTIEINVDTLRVKDLGITTAKLADDAVTAAKLNVDVLYSNAQAQYSDGLKQHASGALYMDNLKTLTNGSLSTIPANRIVYVSSAGNYENASYLTANIDDFTLGVSKASAAAAASAPVHVTSGVIVSGFSGLTEGRKYFLSTSGGLQLAAPTGSGDWVVEIGYAVSSTELMFDPKFVVEIA